MLGVIGALSLSVLASGYDYSSPDLFEKARKEKSVDYDHYYSLETCIKAFKEDHCLPTAYVDAIEKGEPYVSLWRAETLINDGNDVEAEELLLRIDKESPGLSRVKWLLAKNLFFRSDRMAEEAVDEKDKYLTQGVEYARECLKLAPEDINCHLNLATLLGRWSTNQGILKGAFNAEEVRDAMLKASSIKQHYRYPSGNTALGASYYALGIFYRLAPDSFWIELFFNVRGDVNLSIGYFEEARKTKTDQIELYTEMAASQFCKSEREDSIEAADDGRKSISICQSIKPKSEIDKISQADCAMLLTDPSLGCGYSRDRQQETDVEKFKAVGR